MATSLYNELDDLSVSIENYQENGGPTIVTVSELLAYQSELDGKRDKLRGDFIDAARSDLGSGTPTH